MSAAESEIAVSYERAIKKRRHVFCTPDSQGAHPRICALIEACCVRSKWQIKKTEEQLAISKGLKSLQGSQASGLWVFGTVEEVTTPPPLLVGMRYMYHERSAFDAIDIVDMERSMQGLCGI